MTKTIGVVGLGSIGSRHAKNLIAMGHKVIGYDPDQSKIFCTKWDATPRTLDAVVIASPTDCHHDDIARLNAIPTFVEKPIMHDLIPTDTSAVLMVGFNLRFHSCVRQAKEWIDKHAIGEPLWGNFTVGQFSNKPDYLRDGVILNWSHEIDLALYLLGPAKVKCCSAINKESLADIILAHNNGCQSTVHLDYITMPEIRQSVIVGTESTIIVDLVNRHAWLRDPDGAIRDHIEGFDSWDENYVEEMEAFIDRIDGKETIGCTGSEGLEVLKICLEAKRISNL